MNFNWFDTSKIDRDKWNETCQPGKFTVVEPSKLGELMPTFPLVLLNKSDSVLILASGSPDGVAYYMANINRVDDKNLEIDQHPLGIAFIGDEPLPSGCFVQHGDWSGRSSSPPADFWNCIQASGLGSCSPVTEIPNTTSGSIDDLQIQSQNEAFQVVVEKMSKSVEDMQKSAET
ncbi:MAG: hypothetical protein KAS36_12515 [Anaerolineales bacterium]|nr:hypothetical protein [Anaerolineales bacterium]